MINIRTLRCLPLPEIQMIVAQVCLRYCATFNRILSFLYDMMVITFISDGILSDFRLEKHHHEFGTSALKMQNQLQTDFLIIKWIRNKYRKDSNPFLIETDNNLSAYKVLFWIKVHHVLLGPNHCLS